LDPSSEDRVPNSVTRVGRCGFFDGQQRAVPPAAREASVAKPE